jgi:uncharacterized protein involved in exopolysaccharide biosynthesis
MEDILPKLQERQKVTAASLTDAEQQLEEMKADIKDEVEGYSQKLQQVRELPWSAPLPFNEAASCFVHGDCGCKIIF